MEIEHFYIKNMCPNCNIKCNKQPHIIYGLIKKPNQEDTTVIKCENYKRIG